MRPCRCLFVPIAVAVAVAAAAAAPPAGAKAISRLHVCGPEGCVDRTSEALKGGTDPHVLLNTGLGVLAEAVPAEPYVRVRFGMGDGTSRKVLGRWSVLLLPRSGFMRADDGTWTRVPEDVRARWRAVAAGIERFPARRLGLGRPGASSGQPDPAGAAERTVAAAARESRSAVAPATAEAGGDRGPWPIVAGAAGTAGLAAVVALAGRALRRRREVDPLGPAV